MLSISIIYIIICSIYLYPFCIKYLGFPELPPLTTQMIILMFFIGTYLTSFIKNKNIVSADRIFRKYLVYVGLFLMIVFLTSVINYNNLILVVKSLLEFGLIGLLLFLTVMEIDLSEKHQEQILTFIYALLFLQIPTTIYQYYVLGYRDPDSISGTISSTLVGGTGVIAVLMSFLMAYGVSQILIKGFSLFRLLIVALAFVPSLLGGARVSLVLFPLTIIITIISFVLFYKKDKIKKSIQTFVMIGIAFSIVTIVFLVVIPNIRDSEYLSVDQFNATQKYEEYENGAGRYSRLQGYGLLFKGVFRNNLNIILGMGNQSITKSNTVSVHTAYLDFINYMPDSLIILASNGILGLLLIITIIMISLPTLKKYLHVETSKNLQVISLSLIPVTINIVIALFYTSTWNSQIAFSYWIILAIIFHRFSIIQRGNKLLKSLTDSKYLE